MKKLFCLLISISLLGNIYPAQWRHGAGENTILGSESASDIDSASYDDVIAPLDRGLSNLQEGCKISYLSASTITVGAGEIMLSNAGGTIRLIQQNTSATTVSWTMIEAGGSESASTTYYLYAYQATATDTDFDVVISTSSTSPTGITYYAKLGSFYNDSSSNIVKTSINNDNDDNFEEAISDYIYDSGWFSVSANGTYTKTHSLGTIKVISELWWSASSDGSSAKKAEFNSGGANDGYGAVLQALSTTQITIKAGAAYPIGYYNASGYLTGTAGGYYRLLILALE